MTIVTEVDDAVVVVVVWVVVVSDCVAVGVKVDEIVSVDVPRLVVVVVEVVVIVGIVDVVVVAVVVVLGEVISLQAAEMAGLPKTAARSSMKVLLRSRSSRLKGTGAVWEYAVVVVVVVVLH
jgi:hypothetical protein